MKKFAVASLMFTAAFASTVGAAAQQAKTQQHAVAHPSGSAQSDAEMLARFAERRRQWLAAGHKFAPPPTTGTCQLTAGKILTTSIDVAKQPASPELSISYQNCTPGFLSVDAYFYSTTTPKQYFQTTFNVGTLDAPTATHGTVTFKEVGTPYHFGAFNPYSAAGTWTLTDIYLADRTGSYSHYAQAALMPLFNTLNLTVINNGKPDTASPLITSGQILTPKVSISAHPYFYTKLNLSDDVSGLSHLFVWVQGPGGTPSVINYVYLPLPVKNTTVKAYDYLGDQTATGTWTVHQITIYDIAGNATNLTNPADIKALLGTTTFKLVN